MSIAARTSIHLDLGLLSFFPHCGTDVQAALETWLRAPRSFRRQKELVGSRFYFLGFSRFHEVEFMERVRCWRFPAVSLGWSKNTATQLCTKVVEPRPPRMCGVAPRSLQVHATRYCALFFRIDRVRHNLLPHLHPWKGELSSMITRLNRQLFFDL